MALVRLLAHITVLEEGTVCQRRMRSFLAISALFRGLPRGV